jgi:AcrR family transcriptional regulator
MLEAAAAVFFEQGYAATSIDAIIERLGGSKRTIYAEFGSKEGLFTALVTESADKALAALAVHEIQGLSLEETLMEFGRRLVTIYMSPTLLGVYRTIVAEGPRFPSLAKAFYEKGPGRAAGRLAEVLEAAKRQDGLDVGDCVLAANHFVGMLRDNLHLQVVLKIRPPPTPKEIEANVALAVRIFLDGVRQSRPAKLEN